MTSSKLIFHSLSKYWKQHLLLLIGIAISTMVISGALMIGEGLNYSLLRIAELNLGKVTHLITSNNPPFSDSLALRMEKEIQNACTSVMLISGAASSRGGEYRLPRVQVWGIDEDFTKIAGINSPLANIQNDEVYLSKNSASYLAVQVGDEIIIRVKNPKLLPLNSPLHNQQISSVRIPVKVAGILGENELGRFQMQPNQVAPFNVFITLDFLNTALGGQGQANHILIAAPGGIDQEVIEASLNRTWALEDLGLSIQKSPQNEDWIITCDRVFIPYAIDQALTSVPARKTEELSYFVNSLSTSNKSTPYSFVSSIPDSILSRGQIIVNKWLADDLMLEPGDTLRLDYFVSGKWGKLKEKSARFIVAKIVPLSGEWTKIMDIPVFDQWTDKPHCREWDIDLPIHFKQIRTKDEEYWSNWKNLPKAFIGCTDAQKLWQNETGKSIRILFPVSQVSKSKIEASLKTNLDLSALGFDVKNIRQEALDSANGAIDFSQLFLGLSFLLFLAGILLNVLLLQLCIEQRRSQIQTLSFLGITKQRLLLIYLGETLLVATFGVLLGLILALGYQNLMWSALNSIWNDLLGTEILQIKINRSTLLISFTVNWFLAFCTLFISINITLKKKPSFKALHKSSIHRWRNWYKGISLFFFLAAIGIFLIALYKDGPKSSILFFLLGLAVLFGLLFLVVQLFQANHFFSNSLNLSPAKLMLNQLRANSKKSVLIITLFAIGTFIIMSVGSNRKDIYLVDSDPSSGTGGFTIMAELAIPFIKDLNEEAIRYSKGIRNSYPIIPLHVHQGDDASCLNLSRVSRPEIIGLNSDEFQNRFQIISHGPELDPSQPWQALKNELGSNTIPAIADLNVIHWGLGLKIGDTLVYKDEKGQILNLKLIGGLKNSIFQGSVLIDAALFSRHFPNSLGTSKFLVDKSSISKEEIKEELEAGLYDQGILVEYTKDRLARFNRIEHTYLSIFLLLGGLGLLLGTISLSVLFARNLLVRKEFLTIFHALGLSNFFIRKLLLMEHSFLLLAGLFIGFLSAAIASWPIWNQASYERIIWDITLIFLLAFLNGLFFLYLVMLQYYDVSTIKNFDSS